VLNKKEIELFLSLFQKTPSTTILHISDSCLEINDVIENFLNEIDGKLMYKDFNQINLERFRLTAKDFGYAIISECLDSIEYIDKFIQEVYHSLENSANLILISNKNKNNLFLMIDILDRNDFRATNSIDIFEDYNLVIAKKMHMWGNGL
jgi:hypothetical protein